MPSNEHLEFSDLSPLMGSEVDGLGNNQPMSEDTFALLRRTFSERSLLLVRDQDLTPASHIAFSRRFG